MVQEQFAGRHTTDQEAFGNDCRRINLQVFTNDNEGGWHRERQLGLGRQEGFIFHLSFSIYHSTYRSVLFVYVRVISWIVLHLSARETIHEVIRNDSMANEK